MAVEMMLVGMSAAYKSMITVRQLHRQIVADFIRRLRIGFTGSEADAEMIPDNITRSLISPCISNLCNLWRS